MRDAKILMVSCNSPMNGFKQVVFQALSVMFGCTNLAVLLLTSQHSAINGTTMHMVALQLPQLQLCILWLSAVLH